GNAQITTGDIAIIGFNGGNNPAELAIVTLSAISSGQTIYITDRGWHPTDGFATANTTAEGLLAWTITTEIPAGTILKASITAGSTASVTGLSAYGTTTLTGWSGLVTASGGDNWFIYTGSVASPEFVYAFANWATNTPGGEASATPWQDTGNVNATTSYLPPILAAGNFSAAFTGSALHGDYINYTGDVAGTKEEILASLADTDKWDKDETTPADLEPGGADFPENFVLPPSPPSTPVLAATSDKGFLDNDQITNVTTPTITGTAKAGTTVTLYDTDGTTVLGTSLATGGNWSITSTTLSSGTHTLTAKATDAASTSAASAGLAITIDTTAPTLAITSNVSVLKIGETASITFTFSEDPSTTFNWDGTDGDVVVTGGTLAAISGSGLTRTATFTPTANATGTASITVTAATYTDVAGNNGGAGTTPALSFDTEAPDAPSTPVLAAASDKGFFDNDQITNISSPEITGTAEAGATVTLYDTDGTTILGTTVATGGNWSITSATLSSGTHTLTAQATDVAGNTGAASAGLSITIDKTAPTLAITSNVSALKIGETASITFTFSEDPSTTFNWSGTTGNVAVTGGYLSAISGSGLTRTAIFTPIADATGTASITVGAATYTDVAGNNGGAGTTPTLTFDTKAPAAPATLMLAAASNSGVSNVDNITNVTTPKITGTAEAAATVTLYDTDGTTVLGTTVATNGVWLINSIALSEGTHTLTAKATDVAGNTGAASAGLSITIDTTAPTLAITSNVSTLKSGETASITFTFSEDPSTTFKWNGTNDDVVVTGGTLAAIAGSGLTRTATFTPTANATGTASITVAAGAYTDVAGNNGGAGTTPTLTFDTEAPAAPATLMLATLSDSGVSNADNITNVTTPAITGTAETGATVTLYD
uniref:Ig-like domain-containing protein n=1 Tax=Parastrongyloides trichosuri TaxID=131310 RepID=A0A0N4ZJM5_PARTI